MNLLCCTESIDLGLGAVTQSVVNLSVRLRFLRVRINRVCDYVIFQTVYSLFVFSKNIQEQSKL